MLVESPPPSCYSPPPPHTHLQRRLPSPWTFGNSFRIPPMAFRLMGVGGGGRSAMAKNFFLIHLTSKSSRLSICLWISPDFSNYQKVPEGVFKAVNPMIKRWASTAPIINQKDLLRLRMNSANVLIIAIIYNCLMKEENIILNVKVPFELPQTKLGSYYICSKNVYKFNFKCPGKSWIYI